MPTAPSDLSVSEEANPEFFDAVGHAVIAWSRLEALMGIAILRLYQIEANKGLVLTANIGFRGLVSILTIQADVFAPREKTTLLDLLKRINIAYDDRNRLAHGVWSCTNYPAWVLRRSIRAHSRKLVSALDPYEIAVIHGWTDSFGLLTGELDAFLQSHAPPLAHGA
jgi:hypothetical protein